MDVIKRDVEDAPGAWPLDAFNYHVTFESNGDGQHGPFLGVYTFSHPPNKNVFAAAVSTRLRTGL